MYVNKIERYDFRSPETLRLISTVGSDCPILGAELWENFVCYFTEEDVHVFFPSIGQSFLVASKGRESADLGTLHGAIKFPENSVAYKHLSHSYVAPLYESRTKRNR